MMDLKPGPLMYAKGQKIRNNKKLERVKIK